jgi:hypothetical protein
MFGSHLGDQGVGIWVRKVVQSFGKVFYLNYWKGERKGCGHSEMHYTTEGTQNSGVDHAWMHANFSAFHPAIWRAT